MGAGDGSRTERMDARMRTLRALSRWQGRIQVVFVVLMAFHWGWLVLPQLWGSVAAAASFPWAVLSQLPLQLGVLGGELLLLLCVLAVAEVLARLAGLVEELAAELREVV